MKMEKKRLSSNQHFWNKRYKKQKKQKKKQNKDYKQKQRTTKKTQKMKYFKKVICINSITNMKA